MEEIIGNKIILRPYRIEDTVTIYKWRSNPLTTKYMGRKFRDTTTYEVIESGLSNLINTPPQDSVFYVIAQNVTKDYIGGIDLTSIDWTDKVGTMSIVIGDEAYRNQGIATEAIGLLLEYAFSSLDLHKVELNVYESNTAALKCYQKNGFKIEGKKREHMIIDGEYHNLVQMGILKSEFITNKKESK